MTMKPLTIVVAVAKNGIIGKNGGMPWPRISEDMKHFRRLTEGHAVIMGRKTFESIGKPLPNRRNIVLTSDYRMVDIAGIEARVTLEEAVADARETDPNPCIIGGGMVYEAALPFATTIHWTEINRDGIDGDVSLPEFDRSQWRETSRKHGEDLTIQFVTYERLS